MSNKVKIGIIGTGYIAEVHAGVLARDERVQLAAVTDLVPEKAVRLAGTHNATPSPRRSKCWKDVTLFL